MAPRLSRAGEIRRATPEDYQVYQARWLARYAFRVGKIRSRPCEKSEEGPCAGRVEMHHADYSRPLDVIFVCTHHHRLMDAPRRPPRAPRMRQPPKAHTRRIQDPEWQEKARAYGGDVARAKRLERLRLRYLSRAGQ